MSHLAQGPIALDLISVDFHTPEGQTLVSDISFHVHAGEILTLAGPNGSGKTTLVKIIAGLMPPSAGRIFLDDLPYETFGFAERAKRIAYVGQSDNPDGRLTVRQYVALGRLPHIGTLTRAEETSLVRNALEITGIERFSEQYLTYLSGGEMQRTQVARAICQQPRLLVLDEPTNHLDPAARGELLSLVSGLGVTIIAVLHDLTLIEPFATHVAVIKNGRLAGYGHPEEILSQQMVRNVFDVNMHRLPHPDERRHVTALDIHISKLNAAIPTEGINS